MVEPGTSSRRSRQPRQLTTPLPHNTEEREFSANQPANFVGSARTIPVNPRLQMHSMSLFIYSSINLDFFTAAGLRERDERAARKAAKKIEKAGQIEAAKAQQTEAAPLQPQVSPAIIRNPNSQFYSQSHSSATPLFSAPDFTNTMHSSPAAASVFQGSNLTLPPRHGHSSEGGWNQNQYVGPQSSSTSNGIDPWNRDHGNQNVMDTGNGNATRFLRKIDTFLGISQARYSFIEDLNSPNLLSHLTQEEINEIDSDPKANEPNLQVYESTGNSSHSNSDTEQEEVAKGNEEFFSNENAGSGLMVSLDYYGFFCAESLFSLLVVGWNSPLANENLKSQQKMYGILKPTALRRYQVMTPVVTT
jgi:hypothetical protein